MNSQVKKRPTNTSGKFGDSLPVNALAVEISIPRIVFGKSYPEEDVIQAVRRDESEPSVHGVVSKLMPDLP